MGSLAISEVVNPATHFPWPTMLETGARRQERSPYEPSYRSPSASSSQRTSSRPRNSSVTPVSNRHSTSTSTALSDTPGKMSTRSIPRRESISQSSSRPTDARVPEPPSPHISPSQGAQSGADTHPVPGPASDATSSTQGSSCASPLSQSSTDSTNKPPVQIKVKDLKHIQSFLGDDSNSLGLAQSPLASSGAKGKNASPQYEISAMPITDVIEMVAGLLTRITTTNDRQHEHLHRHIPSAEGAAGLTPQTSSVLAFHGKNVPSISILSYLTRIHKYCPTTYEVFISLLVYFDRMTEKVNAGRIQNMRQAEDRSTERQIERRTEGNASEESEKQEFGTAPPSPLSRDTGDSRSWGHRSTETRSGRTVPSHSEPISPPLSDSDPFNLSHFFVVDSFNIHRLVIAAITCASKYFSDVFYTNSRYAKVSYSFNVIERRLY